jgi:hypothetical protein
MSPALHSSIRRIIGSQPKLKIVARLTLALIFLLPGFARPTSANVIYVTTLTDKVSSTGGCSLKEAIYSSTLHDSFDGIHGMAIDYTDPDHFITTQCLLGSGYDTIILPTGQPLPVFYLTIDETWDAHNPYGPTATPIINSNITIQGNGATLLGGSTPARLFAVGSATISTPNGVSSGTGSLFLENVNVQGFYIRGGDGGYCGGGGGLGAGGAIYVQNGSLGIQDSTFHSNSAIGGNGGSACLSYGGGGGGGGLNGNGGGGLQSFVGGGAGGGGGSRGNGGNSFSLVNDEGGGGGGGTVFTGDDGYNPSNIVGQIPAYGGPGGYLCGGQGGDGRSDGHSATCPGGGGGGSGGEFQEGFCIICYLGSTGGAGAYGGGGGGGSGTGGHGGFAGGGGGAEYGSGGNGGFGGGGGGYACLVIQSCSAGAAGDFGGDGNNQQMGGGGGALGGAIFSDVANVTVLNSTFYLNFVTAGVGANNGLDSGGAIFVRNASLTINDATISNNKATNYGGGIVLYNDGTGAGASLNLRNTIIANNGGYECYTNLATSVTGSGNLIMSNGEGPFSPCPGVITTGDPQLGPLQLNPPGNTPTMAITDTSAAFNMADVTDSLAMDQRGVDRPEDGGFDIGAYQICPPPRIFGEVTCLTLTNAPPPSTAPLTMQTSSSSEGQVAPPAGVNMEIVGSVVALQATPNPGYVFVNWTGNVTDPTSASTTIIVGQAATVTANFALCNCVIDASSYISVARSGYVYNFGTGRYAQTVTLTNASSYAIIGPVSLVLDSLSSNATLFDAAGVTASQLPAGSPYVTTSISLAPGQSVSFALQFTNPTKAEITYTTRVLAGPGAL